MNVSSELESGLVSGPERLNRYGATYIVREEIRPAIHLILLLAFAGTWQWWNAWAFAALLQFATVAYHIMLVRVNPAVLNARGQKHGGTRKQDKIFFVFFFLFGIAIPVTAGLDVGAPGWTTPWWMLASGVLMTISGISGATWAMAANAHFEVTVRIQEDRGHTLCTTGPYRLIRHPGYSFGMLTVWALPLMFGSLWVVAPVAGLCIATVARTAFEDRTLHQELAGYPEYAATTRYRLLPKLW